MRPFHFRSRFQINIRSRLLTVLFLLVTVIAFSQSTSRTELEKQKKQLLEDIAYMESQLKSVKEKKASSLHELELYDVKIQTRQQLIDNIKNQIRIIEDQIRETKDVIFALENDLLVLKKEYAKMIHYTYKHHTAYNKLLFLFSSSTFNEAYSRMQYMNRYAEYRRRQAELIMRTRDRLIEKTSGLEDQKKEKQTLLDTEQQQRAELDKERNKKNAVVSKLKKQENQLLQDIKQKQKNAKQLDKAIREMIAKEIAAQKERERLAREKAEKEGKVDFTPELQQLSAEFAGNKGKLPWPVDRGYITRRFGKQPHPVLKYVELDNRGIDIKTVKGATAKALFEGVVVNVIFNPGFHKAVLVAHGDYFTVYSNLDEVFVKPGEKVILKQDLGTVHTNEQENNTTIHLELWKGQDVVNPELWLLPK